MLLPDQCCVHVTRVSIYLCIILRFKSNVKYGEKGAVRGVKQSAFRVLLSMHGIWVWDLG